MARIDRQNYLDKEKFTLLGQWFLYVLSRLDGITQKDVAIRAGLDPSTISLDIRHGKNEPERETVVKMIAALHQFATEQGVQWEPTWNDLILHGAGRATDAEIAASERAFEAIARQDCG